MANQQKLAKSLNELQSLLTKLNSGALHTTELESLVDQAREVYELALVLRYKAYEAQIAGSSENKEVILEKEEKSEITIPEPTKVFEAPEQEEVIQPAIDFSLFDEPDVHVTVEVKLDEGTNTEQEKVHLEAVISTNDTDVVAEITVVDEVEEPVSELPQMPQSAVPFTADSDDFVRRFSAIDPSLQSQLAMSRLETLIGSFGLNERLQFINELFDGSSEAFSDAIKSIDAQSDEQAALKKASSLASQFNWDQDSETVEEFVLKIKRRYA